MTGPEPPPLAAAREGAPDAIQCADRFHLWQNLAQHVERAVVRHRDFLKPTSPANALVNAPSIPTSQPISPPASAPIPPPVTTEPTEQSAAAPPAGLATRIRQQYETVKALQANGHGIRQIARQLTIDRKTARRFTQAESADDLIAKTLDRDRCLDSHLAYLTQRWHEGCHDVAILHGELQQRGYRGSARTIYRHLKPLRSQTPARAVPAAAPPPPKIRHVTTWLLRRPEDLDDTERATLAAIQATCPPLDRLAYHITGFAKMMFHRTGNQNLDTWLAAVEADDIPELHTFARGIRQDYTAVRNGLSLPHNSAACKGNVGRLIMWNQICQELSVLPR